MQEARASESWRSVGALRFTNNARGNPVAALDADVSNDTIGDLGSPLGYAFFASLDLS